jgi:AAA domain
MVTKTSHEQSTGPSSGQRKQIDRGVYVEVLNPRQALDGKIMAAIRIVTEDGLVVAYDDSLNIGSSRSRISLAQYAFEQLEWMGTNADKMEIRMQLDAQLLTVADEMAAQHLGRMVKGDPTIGTPAPICGYLVQEEGGTFMVAKPESCKSWLALMAAVSMDAGLDTVWPASARRRRVLFINLERAEKGMQSRLAQVNAVLGLDPERSLLMINRRGQNLLGIIEAARQTIRDNDVDTVVLDSIGKAGMGGLATDEAANLIAETLSGLCPTWLAIAHPPRPRGRPRQNGSTARDPNQDRPLGSIFFDAAADIIVALDTTKDGLDRHVKLTWTKGNDIPSQPPQMLTLHFAEGAGLVGVTVSDAGKATRAAAKKVMDWLVKKGDGGAGPQAIATGAKVSRTVVYEVLANKEVFGKRMEGKRVLYYVRNDSEVGVEDDE